MSTETVLKNYSAEKPEGAANVNRSGLMSLFRREPLLPEAGAGGAPLTAVIAVMSFLAVLSMAAVLIIHQSAGQWTAALKSEITVQVKGASASEIDAGAAAALRILNETAGVEEAVLKSDTDTIKLLEPWLGADNASAFITIPALIEVKVTPALRRDLDVLRNRLAEAAPKASLNDHAAWHNRLATAAQSGQALAIGVFILVMGAASAISIFAARAGLAANHEIVSVLHLVGATDHFIAAEVQRRFFVLGLRGSIVGMIIAFAALFGTGLMVDAGIGEDTFIPQFSFNAWHALWLFTVPLGACLVTAITARLTVLKTLQKQY